MGRICMNFAIICIVLAYALAARQAEGLMWCHQHPVADQLDVFVVAYAAYAIADALGRRYMRPGVVTVPVGGR